MCPAGPSVRGESQNGELSRVFRDEHAFCASLGGGESQNDLEQGVMRGMTKQLLVYHIFAYAGD